MSPSRRPARRGFDLLRDIDVKGLKTGEVLLFVLQYGGGVHVARGRGRAKGAALARDEDVPVEERGALFAHPQRRELFRLLCMRPCARAGALARQAGLSANAARWHLARMVAAGLVVRDGVTYYPRGFIDPRDGPLFRVLGSGTTRDAFRAIFEAPGSTQAELTRALGVSRQAVFKAATVLAGHKPVSTIEDGRYRRYYPTGLLSARREAHRSRVKGFVDALVKRLEVSGLEPHVVRRTGQRLLVGIARGKAAELIELSLDPYTAVLG